MYGDQNYGDILIEKVYWKGSTKYFWEIKKNHVFFIIMKMTFACHEFT